jgi:hypothetical protein
VLARIAQHAGFYMGANHNFALDAMDFVPWVVRWLPEYLVNLHPTLANPTDRQETPDPQGVDPMNRDFNLALRCLRRRIPDPGMPWGAKGPRFVYMLPYLLEWFPVLRFIHVVRDGRDMAFAGNQSQVQDYGGLLLGPEWNGRPEPVRSAALWNKVNVDAHDYGTTRLTDRYLLIRFEDLCDDPARWVQAVFSFIGCGKAAPEAIGEVRKQPTTGRWKKQDPALVEEVVAASRTGLDRFGYVPD